jgi:hypothetical protein
MTPGLLARPFRHVSAAALAFALATAGLATTPLRALAAPQKADGGIRFTYADPNAGSVSWAGAHNGWNATANPMTKGADGAWSVVIALPAGEHQYKFVVDGQWVADPENPVTGGDFGNSVVVVGADGELKAMAPTSNTAYSPKILIGGRVIGLFHGARNPRFDRWELDRPSFDIDLGLDVRISDMLKARVLLNINPEIEDVQEYRARLNYKRGALTLTRPRFQVTAFDSELLGTWDDPLHLVGNIGVFGRPFGFARAGVRLTSTHLGLDSEVQFSDRTEDRMQALWPRYRDYTIDNFPTFLLGPQTQPRYVFELEPVARALGFLVTERADDGFALVQNQAGKVLTVDFGDDGERFGHGDAFEDVFAARTRRSFPGGWTLGLLGRSDRGFNLGRMVLAETMGDSTVQVSNTLYSQQWFGGGVEAAWRPHPRLHVFAEALLGARRMSFVNGSNATVYAVDSILATRVAVDAASASTRNIDGDHRTTDESGRYVAGATWSFAEGDVTLRGSLAHETHRYPAWTQAPIAPAGQPPADHPRFETVEFQRGGYLETGSDLENSATTWSAGWDRNWRYYLNREVLTSLDLEWTRFDYDPRTAWEHQLWFPTGNFWLESGQHVVTVDRLTLLGEDEAIRFRPRVEIPIARNRDVRFAWRGTFAGVELDKAPRYAESIFQLGFDLTRTIRFVNDTRWVKYDAPALELGRGYLSNFAEATMRMAPGIELSFGFGIDPEVLDPVTNEFAYIGRDVFLFERNANGFIAETDYLSLAPQIAAAERALQDERRFQVQAIVRF